MFVKVVGLNLFIFKFFHLLRADFSIKYIHRMTLVIRQTRKNRELLVFEMSR